ncbi:gluconate 2-dehydrogenase subunit 3 family protein [Bradyrhizobium sp. 1(2017)]|uniref:gluconate 2-dehydrogenase subunit 3 family protein n=1 Tax=Bradyrhizobium sp. 1(2017) TaxID=1404888 RepID=UPI00140F383D|nr:gluconate 2-dehydrogenase subunit 3 family protein [Bradyrhizobium sp. 1(2017)]QIO32423.1 gluconate 2-dehydrogenase subunit 3 family protein [Bradyrhizobium sp. 1(2017)]
MGVDNRIELGRRGFLRGVAAVTGTVSLGSPSATAAEGEIGAAPTPEPGGMQKLSAPAAGYQSLGPDEAGFVEALVNVMCPADHLTPNGVDCGLAVYIDRQLAGGFGKGERLYMRGPWKAGKPQQGYQLPLTPEQFFKAGIAATNEAAQRKFSRGFSDLQPDEADAFLHDLAAGKIADATLPIGAWFNELVYPLFVQACFADPIYGGNIDKVFWRMIGYPGLPAVHGEDMVQFRGKPYPGAQDPKAIGDFS